MRTFFDAAFETQIQDHRIVGAVVAVVRDGEVLFKKGYGWADLAQGTPANPDRSLFRIGSISKLFVWTAVMQQVEQGLLSLDDAVNDHLTALQLPDDWPEPVRIRHLLTHTAGFEDKAIGMGARSIEAVQPLGDYLRDSMPAQVRPPGAHASYSNWGASLAAYVVEQVTGQPWSDYVDEHILVPLNMHSTNTHTRLTEDFATRMAVGYTWRGGRFVATPYLYMNDAPSGVMSTTADDMTRFMIAHLNQGQFRDQRILTDATARQMHSPLYDPHPGIAPMLHGFYRSDRNGQVILGHGGDANQFHSNLSLFPAHNLGVFVSFNSDPGAGARNNLIRAFVDHFFPVAYLRPHPAPVVTDLTDYAGEYVPLRSNETTIERLAILVTGATVTTADGELVLNGSSRWIPRGDDRFTGRYADSTLLFERDGTSVTHMLLGTPLSTFRKVQGLDAPGNVRYLIALMLAISLMAACGYGYRAFRRAPMAARLPAPSVFVGWLHAVLLIALYAYLVQTLSGDVEEFIFGVPAMAHLNLWLLALNAPLGLYVAGAAVQHWTARAATMAVRVRYSALGLAALANLWITWYFNILDYPFA